MPTSTIQCGHCGVVLNVPPEALGRKLKCPRCAERIEPAGGTVPSKPSTPPAGKPVSRPASSALTPSQSKPKAESEFELPMATASGDLRETFDLPMMMGDSANSSAPATAGVADAASLLFDDRPTTPKRLKGGDARKQARRCPTCGGFVPQGMSLCGTCGTDLDTGVRVELAEDLLPSQMPRRKTQLPVGVALVGGFSLLASIAFTAFTLVQFQRKLQGAQYFLLICIFSVYASVQFLRSKTTRLLIVALTIGIMIDVVALIGFPIYDAQMQATMSTPIRKPGEDDDVTGDSFPVSDFLDTQKIGWGVAIILGYAGLVTYLNSPPVRRHFEK